MSFIKKIPNFEMNIKHFCIFCNKNERWRLRVRHKLAGEKNPEYHVSGFKVIFVTHLTHRFVCNLIMSAVY